MLLHIYSEVGDMVDEKGFGKGGELGKNKTLPVQLASVPPVGQTDGKNWQSDQ